MSDEAEDVLRAALDDLLRPRLASSFIVTPHAQSSSENLDAPVSAPSLRLFSSQREPVKVTLERDERLDAPLSRRIIDVDDEDDKLVRQRLRNIASIAVDGTHIRHRARSLPYTNRWPDRCTERAVQRTRQRPTLALLTADRPLNTNTRRYKLLPSPRLRIQALAGSDLRLAKRKRQKRPSKLKRMYAREARKT
ncbi:uncharacterized protein L969DRAFT_88906 [Mixia osmundae IAM 14324]|uniref:Uncharacterized protein n=1 Tax=Mixia osmundae (strain CBS 9802 / IAM 14324 / JCM 22182 / KY 12970) TaxID=764103 RepID=G7E7Q6_MIXOS|nr:uncharacterized protein L969DRAFT_88906 [Mixia osmundae IAM 14324]KEI38466.1 hypothetical protein L969DRAFT_88906 [Mixia osmundae IAM 14324]GAA98866.1 hypothetical protein E5Q_05554 [Mixia osmundae IAM 14324]